MKTVVFSGTTEGRIFSKELAALGADVLVSVATRWGPRSRAVCPASQCTAGG